MYLYVELSDESSSQTLTIALRGQNNNTHIRFHRLHFIHWKVYWTRGAVTPTLLCCYCAYYEEEEACHKEMSFIHYVTIELFEP